MSTNLAQTARPSSRSPSSDTDTPPWDSDAANVQDEDAEKGSQQKSQPRSVGFWDSSLKSVRKQVAIGWLRTTLILMTFILSVLSLYWAVLYHVEENLEALKVGVVDFDGQFAPYTNVEPIVGPMIVRVTEQVADTTEAHLGYMTRSPSDYGNDPMAVRQAVYDEHMWAAVIINANATALLQSAVENGNTSYDPLGAAQIIYNEARDQSTVDDYVLPYLFELQLEVSSRFGEMWAQRILSNTTISRSTLARVPQAVAPGIGFSTFNLRPFLPPTATPAVTIGLIYLIIIAFFSFAFFMPTHALFLIPKGHPPLRFWQWIIWRWIATMVGYLFLSLAYSLVSLAFQIPFSNAPAPDTVVATNADAYHRGSFPVYWMLNYFGMIALGLASENVTMFIGQPWTAFWLIFWVITNVCTSLYEISISPRFFYWGYGWPLHHIVEGSRTILFGTHSKIGLNFGVLIAWGALNSVVFPIACTFMRWKTQKMEGKKPGLREILR